MTHKIKGLFCKGRRGFYYQPPMIRGVRAKAINLGTTDLLEATARLDAILQAKAPKPQPSSKQSKSKKMSNPNRTLTYDETNHRELDAYAKMVANLQARGAHFTTSRDGSTLTIILL
jgi:hypothetical protein